MSRDAYGAEVRARRILVAGCGAIGSMVGCLLRQAGHDVALLGRPWHLDAIAREGLYVDGLWGEHHSTGFELATRAGELSGAYDLLLVTVKAYDTESVVASVAECLTDDGLALALQNGLGNVETLAQKFGAERSLGASVLIGARIAGPGRVTVTVQAAPIVLGPLSASLDAMRAAHGVADCFAAACIPCEATDRILSFLWAKVFYNAALNGLGALLGVHYGALGEDPDLRAIMDQIVGEAFGVAKAKGVELPWSSAEEYRKHFYAELLPPTYEHRSSMLQDLERGRRTEIGALNGKIWQYGEDVELPTPANQLLTRLVAGLEKRGRS